MEEILTHHEGPCLLQIQQEGKKCEEPQKRSKVKVTEEGPLEPRMNE